MVNTEQFIHRLENLLEYYSLSASAFADKLGVQRSSLSHLLSGRNKPSLDFVMKVIENFPEVDLYWLLNGKGHFPKQEAPTLPPAVKQNEGNKSRVAGEDVAHLKRPEASLNDFNTRSVEDNIDRIVVFYQNGTFKSYTP